MEEKVIVVASTNAGKIREFKEMLEPEGYTVKSLADYPDIGEIEENGTTFEENAIIKAKAVTDRYGIMAISDDSGLSIDAFDGGPGIHSARFLGHDTSYDYKNRVILERLAGNDNRNCHYTCAIAVTRPGKEPVVFSEICACTIADEPRGTNGFGYDPIFIPDGLNEPVSTLKDEEKNAISHRGIAFNKLINYLKSNNLI